MADAALVLYDPAGNLLCDSRNVNMFLRYSGLNTGGFSFAATKPVVFFRPTGGNATMRRLRNNGNGTFTVSFVGGQVEYYIFDSPWVTGGPIDIWSESGQHIFMSTARPMNVYANIRSPRYWNRDGSGRGYIDGYTAGGLPSAKWAYCPSFNRQGYQCYPIPGGTYSSVLWGETYQASPTGVFSSIQDSLFTYGGWAPIRNTLFVSEAEDNDIAVIDVTGWM